MGRAPYLYRTVPPKSGSAQMPIPELTENYQKYPTEFFRLKWLKRLGTLHRIYFFYRSKRGHFPPKFFNKSAAKKRPLPVAWRKRRQCAICARTVTGISLGSNPSSGP